MQRTKCTCSCRELGVDEASKTYTFHLRKDVTFHDGETFTSADVKFTLDTIMNPDNASEIASNYEDITGMRLRMTVR